MDLKEGGKHLDYLTNFPFIVALNINFVAYFKLPPVYPLLNAAAFTNGPLVSVKFYLNHEYITISHSVDIVVDLGPIIFVLAPQTRVFGRHIVKKVTNLEMNLA